MNYLLPGFVLCFSLSACYHNDVTPVEAEIDYPPLSAQNDLDAMQELAVADISDVDEAKVVLFEALSRLMNVAEIANTLSDEISGGSTPQPLYKVRAKALIILEARSDLCVNNSDNKEGENSTVVEASIWNDVDNDGTPNLGDELSYIWNNCKTTISDEINGVMTSTGMLLPIKENSENQSSIEIEEFENRKYTFDLQVDSLNNNSAFFQNTNFVFSRALEDDNEISTLEILTDSIMGVSSGTDLYVYNINAVKFVSNEDDRTVELSIDARYYFSKDETNGYVDIMTTENLLFEYSLDLTSVVSETRLLSGELTMVTKDDVITSLSVDSDKTQLKISQGDSAVNDVTVEQSELFDTGSFGLVNLTGVIN